jgi:hypothetical protein
MGSPDEDNGSISLELKERVVVRLLPPESSAVKAVSQTVEISVGTLERWRAKVLARPSGDEALEISGPAGGGDRDSGDVNQ